MLCHTRFEHFSDFLLFQPMHTKRLFPLLCCLLPLALLAQPKLKLIDFATGFSRPIGIEHCGDSRLFIIEKVGKIWVLDSLGVRQTQVFLDIANRVKSSGNEQGLLGLAFHPDYAQNGWFFVHYIKSDGNTRVARFSRSTANPNVADPASELTILEQSQPYSNHNGGSLAFGPDGYLYIGLGDGGSGGDPQGNGQKPTTFLGKLLRIDVNNSSSATPYVVPANNPFVGSTTFKPEIWAYGLRNPWRFSFDRLNGDLWIGDVGQNAREEIDYQPAGDAGGRNYGWNCFEGNIPYDGGCPVANHTPPAFDYLNPSIGCSVTGGYRYRGSKYPNLYGKYLFTDYCSGRWWTLTQNANGSFVGTIISDLADNSYTTLGEDVHGELYVATDGGGKIQKITDLCAGFSFTGESTAAVCDQSFSGTVFLNVTGGLAPVTFLWSNGFTDKDIVYLNPGAYSVNVKDANGCELRDTFEIASLSPPAPTVQSNGSSTVLCFGDSIALNSSPAPAEYGYQWFNGGNLIVGATTQQLSVSEYGLYSVQLTNPECNSVRSDSILIDQEVAISPEISWFDGYLITAGPWAGYQWFFNNQPITGATDTIYAATQSGVYRLQATSANGCTYQSNDLDVVVSGTALPVNVTKFSLAPNPTADQTLLKMELRRTENSTISLTDGQGRTVFSKKYQEQKIALPIDLRSLPVGTYFLNVQTESGTFVRQLVKQ